MYVGNVRFKRSYVLYTLHNLYNANCILLNVSRLFFGLNRPEII